MFGKIFSHLGKVLDFPNCLGEWAFQDLESGRLKDLWAFLGGAFFGSENDLENVLVTHFQECPGMVHFKINFKKLILELKKGAIQVIKKQK